MANVLGNVIKKGKGGVELFIDGVKNTDYTKVELDRFFCKYLFFYSFLQNRCKTDAIRCFKSIKFLLIFPFLLNIQFF
jgi:hypothetical protein